MFISHETMKAMLKHISNFTKDVCSIWITILHRVVKDEGLLIFLILVPLAYPLLYSWIYNNEVVREVPVAVVDDSHSTQSRRFTRLMDATPDVKVAYMCNSMDEARLLIGRQEVYGILYFPEDFATKNNRMEQTHVGVYCNMAIMLAYKAIFQASSAVSTEMNADIQRSLSGNHTDREDEITVRPLDFEEVPIFNSTGGYGNFILPGVLVLIIHQVLLLGIGMLNGTMYEHRRYDVLTMYSDRSFSIARVVTGHTLCFFILFLVLATYVLLGIPQLFGFVQILHFGDFLLFIVPYLLACIFFATTVSYLVRQRENIMLFVVFTSVPLLFLSGVSWPQSNIPTGWSIFSNIFPSTFGIRAFVKMNTLGAVFSDIRNEWIALWIQTAIYFVTTCLVTKRLIRFNKVA